MTGGLFRPALTEDGKRGPKGDYWGGLTRTLAGIEGALAWSPTAGRGKDGRIPDLLRPANGTTGPGPDVFLPWRQVLTLAGEHVDPEGDSPKDRQRWKRRRDGLVSAGYLAPGRGEAKAGDTIEVVKILDGRGGNRQSGLVVRASARMVEAVRKSQDKRTWTRLPASRVFEDDED